VRIKESFAILCSLVFVDSALGADTADLDCRFMVTGHSAVPTVVDMEGQWIARDNPGYKYLTIGADEVREFFSTSRAGLENNYELWLYQRTITDTEISRTTGERDYQYQAERIYLKFRETNLLDSMLIVQENLNGPWHATLIETSTQFAFDPDTPGHDGLVRHGRGHCAPRDHSDPKRND
jgi:hypothetical protein